MWLWYKIHSGAWDPDIRLLRVLHQDDPKEFFVAQNYYIVRFSLSISLFFSYKVVSSVSGLLKKNKTNQDIYKKEQDTASFKELHEDTN